MINKLKNFLTQKTYSYDILALVAGAILVTGFAPFHFYFVAPICLALLLSTWLGTSAKRAFWRGLLFGLGFFGTGISWVYISIHTFGNTNALLAGLLTFLFALILALFPAVNGYLLNKFFPKDNYWKLLIAFPSIWVLLEWIRTWLFTGFPWLFVGNSQTDSLLAGFAPVIGVYGISFLVTLIAALLLIAVKQGKKCSLSVSAIIIIVASAGLLNHVHWTTAKQAPIETVLIQGNIPQQLKWQSGYLNTILETYLQLTSPYWNKQLIIWPEAAIPLPLDAAQAFVNRLNKQAVQHEATLITGIPVRTARDTYYNALLSVGMNQGRYYKRHLVPFGEYLPFDNVLRGLINFFNIPMSNFSSGATQQEALHIADATISPFICYEIAYPQEVRNSVQGKNLLLTISDDSWFGRSFALAQHLQIARMRSIETGKPQLFAANDGITAFIDAKGKVTKRLPTHVSRALAGQITPTEGETPWVKMGLNPLLTLILLLLFIAWLKRRT